MGSEENNALQLRELILNTKTPVVFRNFTTSSKCFESLEDWCGKFDDCSPEMLEFEKMPVKHWDAPQWERNRTKVQMRCEDFLNFTTTNDDHWLGLNYKRAFEIPLACREDVDFSCFGFPHASQDTSYWLSSKGANTPCHYDTYGCNIVVQIYGRKSWLLFPPKTPLSVSRIPYEESSVYCTDNFYSPTQEGIKKLNLLVDSVFHCVLNTHDVLIVPRHWWHYVESLENSLSVNAWIPLECDIEAQVEECIAKFLMERLATAEDRESQSYLLNPNQVNDIAEDKELFAILKHLIDTREGQKSAKSSQTIHSYQYMDDKAVNKLLKDFPTASVVKKLTQEEFHKILTRNSQRFDAELSNADKSPMPQLKEVLINSICHPSVIEMIKQIYYKQLGIKN